MAERPILVVKVGTSTLLGTHERPSDTFGYVADSLVKLQRQYNVVLVTSGAIGFGVRQLGLKSRPTELHQLQALSMLGQVGLLRKWREAFDGVAIGQVLVTRNDLARASTSQLLRDSMQAVWGYGAVPIVNENDAVSFDEISFGDNDRLAAEVAATVGAKKLVILTDQDGIQAEFGNPQQHRLKRVRVGSVDAHIKPTLSAVGKGGASSKVQASKTALEADVEVYIAHAAKPSAVQNALAGKVGTKIVQ